MIFVTLGTQKFQLNRLLMMLDELIEREVITEKVVAQIGNSTYKPNHFQYEKFIDRERFLHLICESNLVITHSGVGTIMTAINANKPVIVFPRQKKYKEHVDDHQLEIAHAFASKGYVLEYIESKETLEALIKKSSKYNYQKYESGTQKIINCIEEFIANGMV